MANETDKQFYEEVRRSFDAAALTLNELAAEILQCETKFGRESSITKKKIEQLQALRSLYDSSLKYINYLRDLNHQMYNEVICRELERHKRETGLSYAQLAELAGWDTERWERVDKFDDIIQAAKAKLKVVDDDGSLESLINSLRAEK